MRILVADDTASTRKMLCALLSHWGYSVVGVESGEEAVTAYKQQRPDLVMLDVVMHGIGGYGAARAIRSLDPEEWIPIIFLSAMRQDSDIATGIEAGGDDYLTKPLHELVLRSKLMAMERIATMRRRLIQATEQANQANRELQRLAHLDGLTGVANRRYFDSYLHGSIERADRLGQPLTLLIADVDHFKKYNDFYGHPAGDTCLKSIGAILQSVASRPGDLVARFGGEEFATILPDTPLTGGLRVAQKIMDAASAAALAHAMSPTAPYVTMSIGATVYVGASREGAAELIARADKALYQAKALGRHRFAVGEIDSAAARTRRTNDSTAECPALVTRSSETE